MALHVPPMRSNLNGSDEHRCCLGSWYMLLPQNPLMILSSNYARINILCFLSSPHPRYPSGIPIISHFKAYHTWVSQAYHPKLQHFCSRLAAPGPVMLTVAPARTSRLPWAPLARSQRSQLLPRFAAPRRLSWSWLAATWHDVVACGHGIPWCSENGSIV